MSRLTSLLLQHNLAPYSIYAQVNARDSPLHACIHSEPVVQSIIHCFKEGFYFQPQQDDCHMS